MPDIPARRNFGWKPQLPDPRDHVFRVPEVVAAAIPSHLTKATHLMPPVWDQGDAGSCTGNGTAAALAYDRHRQGGSLFTPSRLMLYYDGRSYEGTQGYDAGAAIRDVVAGAVNIGVCDEAYWPYDLSRLTTQPTQQAYAHATYKIASYEALPAQDLSTIKATLAAGCVIVFGFTVFSNFMTKAVATTGLVPMPAGVNEGGHCVVACGYNSKDYVLFRNSWGTGWGDPDFPGYGWMPGGMISNPNVASDFWVINAVSG
jgi:C1A family cysteine protease